MNPRHSPQNRRNIYPKPDTSSHIGKRYGSRSKKEETGWHWSYTVMLSGFFFGLITLIYAGNLTVISKESLARILIFFCLVGLLIPMKWYRTVELNRLESVLFNVMGLGPFITALLLWFNFFIHSEPREEVYRIVDKELKSGGILAGTHVVFTYENDAYADFEEFRRFEITLDNRHIKDARRVQMNTAKGILGYKIVVKAEPLME